MEPVIDHASELRAAALLHVDIVPGTEIMRDVGDVHFTHAYGNVYVFPLKSIIGKNIDINFARLVPHPSDNPTDPLNWSKTWKREPSQTSPY
jgi:hypothetical protein